MLPTMLYRPDAFALLKCNEYAIHFNLWNFKGKREMTLPKW